MKNLPHLPSRTAVAALLMASVSRATVPPTDPILPPDQVVHLVANAANVHPRLLVTPEELAALQGYALTPGNPFYQQLLSYLGSCTPPTNTNWLTDETEAQRQGYWRLPTVSLEYLIKGDQTSFNNAKGFLDAFLAQPHWETGTEQDIGMGAANIMIGAAIAYDSLYNQLDPTYRQQFHDKLLLQARTLYYDGFLGGNSAGGYWSNDPQNNHRWHRDAGLTLAVLAVADGTDATNWMVQQTKQELDFVTKWLPPDGSDHEGPGYAVFGEDHLTLALEVADRDLGTNYMGNAFFSNVVNYRLATLTPGFGKVFAYGDSDMNSIGYFNNYLFLAAAKNHQADQEAALMQIYQQDPDAFDYGWMSLIYNSPTLTGGSVNNLPKKQLFADIGFAEVRDGWNVNNVAMSFKCGPYGGYTLNQYRNTNNYHYINVAHDDPDANSFEIYARGQMFAQPDGYSYDKRSSNLNTILVNGTGQKGEGQEWTQPLSGNDQDMSKLAQITLFQDRGNVTIMEGEAGNAYYVLSRYRRTAVFDQGKYILLLDDIRAPQPNAITWLVQSAAVDIVNAAQGQFDLRVSGATLPFELRGNVTYTSQVVTSTADNQGTSMGLKQLQATATTSNWRTSAVFDAWGLGNVDVTFIPLGSYVTDLQVTGPGFSDLWRWDSTAAVTVILPEPIWTGATNHNWTSSATDVNWGSSWAWSNSANRAYPFFATFNLPSPAAITVNGTIDAGSLTFTTGGWTLAAGTGVLAFGATGNMAITTTTGTDTINAILANGSSFGTGGGVTKLTKAGAGTLILGGANTYSGGTTVNAGLLLANNSSGSATGTGNVIMNGGKLGGSGNIAGFVMAGSGAHTIHPGEGLAHGSAATLTVHGLTTGANTTLAFNLVTAGASGVGDRINITSDGGLTLNGGAIQIADTSGGPASLGYYKILQYVGAIWGAGVGSLTLPATVNNVAYVLDATHDPGFIDLHRGLLGDANDDGIANFADFIVLSNNFGASGAGWSAADFNNDGITNFSDFIILSDNFGATIGANEVATESVATGVPEPASLLLLGAGFCGLIGSRRRRSV